MDIVVVAWLGDFNVRKKSLMEFQFSFIKDNFLGFTNIKFIYSEKAKTFFKIFTLLLSYKVPVKSKEKFSQNCVAFSE